jgi:hypothetical protein
MSKMDNQRAMREAKYARDQARAKALAQTRPPSASAAARAPVAPPAPPPPLRVVSPDDPVDLVEPVGETGAEALCGHRSMNGRTCTRESGHSSKSHRYG